jgi:hypothetical protein
MDATVRRVYACRAEGIMRTHVLIVAWLNIIYNAIGLCAALLLGLFMLGIGGAIAASDHQALPVLGIFGSVGVLIFGLIAVTSIPGVIAGVGLLGGANWARILAIILAILELMTFPLGTLLGIYSLIVLLHPETALMFERRAY